MLGLKLIHVSERGPRQPEAMFRRWPFSGGRKTYWSWWRHQMETFSALLAICAGTSPVTGEFPSQRPVTRSFDVLFHLCLNKRLSKQSWGWWFETPSRPLWRHWNISFVWRPRPGWYWLKMLEGNVPFQKEENWSMWAPVIASLVIHCSWMGCRSVACRLGSRFRLWKKTIPVVNELIVYLSIVSHKLIFRCAVMSHISRWPFWIISPIQRISIHSLSSGKCIKIFRNLNPNDNFCQPTLYIFVKLHWDGCQ